MSLLHIHNMSRMNKRNIWTLSLTAILFAGGFTSCDDDDDDSNKLNYDDPRIRTMSIPGFSNTFIVNDVESIIYNYDSLSFGSNVKAIHPNFSGYQVQTPIFYDSAGTWKSYPRDTTFKLDFSKGMKIRSMSYDSSCYKDYKIDIRIHLFDVEAFEWNAWGDSCQYEVVGNNEKAVFSQGEYHIFSQTETGTTHLVSKDGKKWSAQKEFSYEATPEWGTLTAFNKKLYVLMGDSLYETTGNNVAFQPSQLQLPKGYGALKPLFVLDNKFWALAKEGEKMALCYASVGDSAFTAGDVIKESISFVDLTAIVSSSGSTDLGYIFTRGKEGDCVILSVDKSGSLIRPTQGKTFAYREGMTIFNYEKLLCVMGGINADGSYSNEVFSSTDSGISWTKNTHRVLPGNGKFSHAGVFADSNSNSILLLGGNHGKGSNIAWKGILKQFIMDDLIFGKN